MKQVSIIQTADIHGNIRDYSYIAAYIGALRARGESVLVVDCGDIFRGDILSESSGGQVTASIMNHIGYDFMVFGNDEHFHGPEEINAMRNRLSFPVLGALTRLSDGSRLFDAYGITSVGGFRIGVIGLECCALPRGGPMPGGPGPMSPGMKQSDLSVREETELAVEALQAQGCDLLMVISHLGVDDTYPYPTPRLAADVPTLDLIADGHSHHPLPKGIQVGRVLVTQPEDHMASFVHIQVWEDAEGHRESECQLITMDWCRAHLEPDPEIQAILDAEQHRIDKAKVCYGVTPVLLDGGRPQIRQRETNLGDLVCDAILHISGADIAFCGGGAIRASIPPGEITNYDVASVFANGGDLALYRCKGRWILSEMENSLFDQPKQSPGFIQVGGLQITYTPERASGNRVVSIKLSDSRELLSDQWYTVAKEIRTPGPHGPAQAGDPSECVMQHPLGTLEQAMIEYLQNGNPVYYSEAQGRILAITE